MEQITEFQYPDGWYMKVGQIYSSPYEENHFLVTRFEQEGDDRVENIIVYYKEVDSNDYNQIIIDEEQCHRAWWINEGNWDLEQETITRDKFYYRAKKIYEERVESEIELIAKDLRREKELQEKLKIQSKCSHENTSSIIMGILQLAEIMRKKLNDER